MKSCVVARFDKQSNTFRSIVCQYEDSVDLGCVLRDQYSAGDQAEYLISLGNINSLGHSHVDAHFKDGSNGWNRVQPKEHSNSFKLLDYCDLVGSPKVYIFNGEQWCELLLTFSNMMDNAPLKNMRDRSAL